jgi:hypothetical protein
MRGEDERSGSLFSYVYLESRVGKNHPLRVIRAIVNEALAARGRVFGAVFADRATLDSSRKAIAGDAAASVHSVFSKNRDRLLAGDIAAKLLSAVLAQPRVKRLLSTDHLSVDGTLIEALASIKSLKPKDGSDGPPAGRERTEPGDGFSRREAFQRHARFDHRSRGQALSQSGRQGGQARLRQPTCSTTG